MPEQTMKPCAYRVLRYAPNVIRDEWFNVGILMLDPASKRLEARMIESDSEFARLRRLHPTADLNVVRALQSEFNRQIAALEGDSQQYVEKLDSTLSNVLQLSPQRAVLTENFDAELDRLYRDYIEPPRYSAGIEAQDSRSGIRTRANDVFRRAGILRKMQHGVSVAEYTYPGDPLRMDHAYQRNGTRGFVHALSLARDPAQAKALAFTSERIRARVSSVEFTAVSEAAPREDNERHRFIAGLLADQGIALVPVPQLEKWARELGASLR